MIFLTVLYVLSDVFMHCNLYLILFFLPLSFDFVLSNLILHSIIHFCNHMMILTLFKVFYHHWFVNLVKFEVLYQHYQQVNDITSFNLLFIWCKCDMAFRSYAWLKWSHLTNFSQNVKITTWKQYIGLHKKVFLM